MNGISSIRDNHSRGNVANFLQQKLVSEAAVSIVSAYFTIYAYDALSSELEQIKSLRFLFGDPQFISLLDPEKNEKKAFRIEDEGLTLDNQLKQKQVAARCAKWISEKVEIRSIRQSNLLHAKMYHIDDGRREHAITGSSNFTRRGLGLSQTPNIELNMIVDSDRDRTDLKAWFDAIWGDERIVEDVKEKVLSYLDQLYVNHAPDFIYFKTLYHIFEQYLNDQQQDASLFEQLPIKSTQIWNMLFPFQRDGVKAAIHKINQFNGCILADSVGLGKTFSALAIIKYFELRNERVLVLCPKKLRENWTIYLASQNSAANILDKDRFGYTVLSHTDLTRESGKTGDIDLAQLNWNNYDLVVIDESHNFRNDAVGKKDSDGKVIRKTRYERLIEDVIKSGVKTKVLLLSATPVNNDLSDLRNQIYLMTGGHDGAFSESLGIDSLKGLLKRAQNVFTQWSESEARDSRDLMAKLPSQFFSLLDGVTIARSRKHIERYFKDSMEKIGHFPTRKPPVSVFSGIDTRDRFISFVQLNAEILKLNLSLYQPLTYVDPRFKQQYELDVTENFSQGTREKFLIYMMKVNFLKRLESSVYSFHLTMQRTVEKIELLERRLTNFKQQQAQDERVNITLADASELEEDQDLQQAEALGKRQYRLEHMQIDAWLAALAEDKRTLGELADRAEIIDAKRDAKLIELRKLVIQKIKQPTQTLGAQPNKKVLVFSAFADTARYLYEQILPDAQQLGVHIALVSGGSGCQTTLGKPEFNEVLTLFSPISKKRHLNASVSQTEEIDILIATDCISEGQNLQDCDYLINYDIHWNPVRLIQRFGRIDRIGSINPSIQMVNFWPTADLNEYINLKGRVESRMALVDLTATAEDNLLAVEDAQQLAAQELRYRDHQLERFATEVPDLEDFNESVTLSEFNLDDFRMDLTAYIEANRTKLEQAPMGLYSIVPTHPEYPTIREGVIFCLRQTEGQTDRRDINPLQPYFLVYVQHDGTVKFNFSQAKQILDMFRLLCQHQSEPHAVLCDAFDAATQHGQDMSAYSEYLRYATDAIAAQFGQKNRSGLFAGRGGKLMRQSEQVTSTTTYELITWLIIQSPSVDA
jgi:SNF2 family DNA or RNA helicase